MVLNPNVGTFEILAPDGKKFITDKGIPEFVYDHSEYDIKPWQLYHSVRIRKKYKGWLVIKLTNDNIVSTINDDNSL